MADKVQRPQLIGDVYYDSEETDAYMNQVESERAEFWTKNRELLGSHDVKSAALQSMKDELSDTKKALELEKRICDSRTKMVTRTAAKYYALHASIIDQGRKVLNATSEIGMSHAEYIEWVIGELEGK